MQEIFFIHPKGSAVADLMEVSNGFRTFPTGASHFQIQIVGGVLHAIHPSDQTDPREVEHEGKTNPRPDVGGAGGQVPQLFIEREVEVFIQKPFATFGVGPSQGQPSGETIALDAKVILFVDHDREAGVFSVAGQAVGAGLQKFGADQVSFQKNLPFRGRGRLGIKPMQAKFWKAA